MAKDKKTGHRTRKPVTSDARFSSVHSDPRFRLPDLKKLKVKVDDRFSKKELEKLNTTATGHKAKVDRYGRKLKDKQDDVGKYFEHESDESESEDESEDEDNEESESDDEKTVKPKKVVTNDSSDSDSESEPEVGLDRARGEGLESSDDSSDSEPEDEAEESDIELEESKPEEGEPSDTFAVVNLDWDRIRSVDLMATFLSFVPSTGSIKSVTIYPSEFGKEQMQKEDIEGPPKELFRSKKKKQEESDDSDDELDLTRAEDLEKAARKLYQEDDGQEDYDSKALRRYQLQRLRYYYAVVKCDSVATAKNIYDNCDGTEYESTANIFDLRYVPEGMEFDDEDAKDVCTKIPINYKPNSTFVTDALNHSKVKLTWDETPEERLRMSSRQFTQREIDEMDFKAYLASDTDESDGDEKQSAKDKYRSLLGGGFGSFGKGDDEDDVDMEITFDPGLKEGAPKTDDAEKEEKEESTIDAYRRKEKERRQQRLAKFKEDKEEVKETKKDTKNDDEKRKAELELIMMDEQNQDGLDHFDMKHVLKSEKSKNKKHRKKNIDNELVQEDFEADLNDPRFKEVFENHDYAIDPTSSEYKKTSTMQKIMKERSKRHRGDSGKPHKKQKTKPESSDLNSLVSKIKKRKH